MTVAVVNESVRRVADGQKLWTIFVLNDGAFVSVEISLGNSNRPRLISDLKLKV